MQTTNAKLQVNTLPLSPEEPNFRSFFRMYNYEGNLPARSDFLTPHRKDYYLIALIRKADSRQWIDTIPYQLKNNTIYFTSPDQVIVKEDSTKMWSTAIAFTKDFLAFQESASFSKLPIIDNPKSRHELLLSADDVVFVEDLLGKINNEYNHPSEWQQRMITAFLNVLLTYLSKLYNVQFKDESDHSERLVLKNYQQKINEHFRDYHEVSDYASLLNISAGHLSELVKTQSGKPAIKHIHHRLVLEARTLLFHTDTPLKQISFDLGFSDASYFNRFFKRETGSTPADYRSQIREMYQ